MFRVVCLFYVSNEAKESIRIQYFSNELFTQVLKAQRQRSQQWRMKVVASSAKTGLFRDQAKEKGEAVG